MLNQEINWTVMWRWYHSKLFWALLAVGILVRILVVRRYGRASWINASLFAIVAGTVSSVCAAWFPILPVLLGGLLSLAVGIFTASMLFIAGPLIVVSMAFQTALIDAISQRLLLKTATKAKFIVLLLANLLITLIALAYILAWAIYHPIEVIA